MVEELFVIPSSFAQQRLWFLDQLEPGNAIYNIPGAFRLEGQLDTTVLARSLNEIVRRHEVLRTAFAMVDGEPVQIITPSLELELPVIDLTQLETRARAERVGHLLSEERRRGFNLEQAPLLRARVLRLGAEEHVFSLTLHHIVADAWSIGIFARELATLYACYQANESSPLPEISVQYADYAVWQRQRLAGNALEAEVQFWQRQLAGAPTLLELPVDRERPAMGSFRGAKQPVEISLSLSRALRRLSQSEGVTPFMTLLAGFALLLQRYTGQDDILIGTPIAGRTQPETKDLIGFFVNTLVLRTNLSGNPTVREFLARVKEVCWDAYAHQEVPFERLVEELQPERSLSHSPLFQVMLAFNNTTQEEFQLSGLKLTQLEMESDTAKFDLTLTLLDDGETLTGVLRYNSDLFDPATISRMLGHWERLLEGLVANPEKKISELALLSTREWEELESWNETEAEERGRSVAEEFEKQVARTPDEVAVVYEGATLSYGELNERANQLGHYLRRQGVGAETLVGVCLERSVELVVGMLGVLKAGGAYVPIDPQYPAERVKYLLADGGVQVVVTTAAVWKKSLGGSGERVVRVDEEQEAIGSESGENPVVASGRDNLAYVIYTSGSTGTPKGVMVSQRAILNHLQWRQRVYPLGPEDRFLQKRPSASTFRCGSC